MPNKTIYIKPEDEDKWNAIDNKSLFVSMSLSNYDTTIEIGDTSGTVDFYQTTSDLSAPPVCCVQPGVRCKHWDFKDGQWINRLTGKTLEAED